MTRSTLDSSLFQMDQRDFVKFRELIHRHTGIWLRDGKHVMLASRLTRRLRHCGLTSFADYYSYLEQAGDGDEEFGELINCVTTNKTSFFREAHHFHFLAETLVPELRHAALRGAEKNIRIWSGACSTGEEPYSIVISLLEALQAPIGANPNTDASAKPLLPLITAAPGGWTIQVVASDIDTKVLEKAARAIYSQESLEDIPAPLREKYFLRGKDEMAGQVKVKPEVARCVHFKRINLQDPVWPLDGLFDAIFFRNALIYFNHDTQDAFLRRMLRFLRPRGYLFLGHSEHIPWLHGIVAPLNKTMYRLRETGR